MVPTVCGRSTRGPNVAPPFEVDEDQLEVAWVGTHSGGEHETHEKHRLSAACRAREQRVRAFGHKVDRSDSIVAARDRQVDGQWVVATEEPCDLQTDRARIEVLPQRLGCVAVGRRSTRSQPARHALSVAARNALEGADGVAATAAEHNVSRVGSDVDNVADMTWDRRLVRCQPDDGLSRDRIGDRSRVRRSHVAGIDHAKGFGFRRDPRRTGTDRRCVRQPASPFPIIRWMGDLEFVGAPKNGQLDDESPRDGIDGRRGTGDADRSGGQVDGESGTIEPIRVGNVTTSPQCGHLPRGQQR